MAMVLGVLKSSWRC